ncbi:MAG: peptidoglycan-binding domain-containing protein [Pseudomonadota bacterium]
MPRTRHPFDEPRTGRLTAALLANPLASAAMGVSLLWAGVVGVNAAYLQDDTHPAPLWATRGMAVLPGTSVLGDRPAAADADNGIRRITISPIDPLIEELQIALAEKNFYSGGLDGKIGAKTREAIRSYQRAAGFEVSGEPSGRLLAHVRMSSIRGSMTTTPAVPRATPSGDKSKIVPPEKDLIIRIQRGLKAYGSPELDVDGIMGAESRAAITAFQRAQGMTVSGEASPQVLRRLIEIGAL